ALVAAAPAAAHGPNHLQAAAHYLVLDRPSHPLAAVYDGSAGPDVDPVPLVRELVLSECDVVAELLATRSVQTNEIGRVAPIAAGLGRLADRLGPWPGGERIALVDVGCSAGLNLLVDRYRIVYLDGSAPDAARAATVATVGPEDAAVVVPTRWLGGAVPEPPAIGWRRGIDREPRDVTDPETARWLTALTWPGQPDRVARVRAAVAMAAADPPPIQRADALAGLEAALAAAPADLPVVVVTSWVVFYFDADLRLAFDGLIAGADRPVAWLSLEMAGVVELPAIEQPQTAGELSLIGVVATGGAGSVVRESLGWVHPHGAPIHWS
ncbi:MAG: DUF2332 domain-containing protein, partial [Actinomycetota bacterium]